VPPDRMKVTTLAVLRVVPEHSWGRATDNEPSPMLMFPNKAIRTLIASQSLIAHGRG